MASYGTTQRRLLGEKCTGANPTDRAKSGTKRSMVVDGKGVPLGIELPIVINRCRNRDFLILAGTQKQVRETPPWHHSRAPSHQRQGREYGLLRRAIRICEHTYRLYHAAVKVSLDISTILSKSDSIARR